MIDFLTIGAALGLSAGLAPGPLLTLVISETLQHGVKSGVKVALAPVITDLPITLLTFFTLLPGWVIKRSRKHAFALEDRWKMACLFLSLKIKVTSEMGSCKKGKL